MIITLSGMSTSGKTFLAKALSELEQFEKTVSVTTRPIREGEVDGRDYHFVSRDDFQALIAKGEFLEYEASHKAMYGTAAFEIERILAKGSSAVLVLEPEGALSMERIARARGLPFASVYIETAMPVIIERLITERMDIEMRAKGCIDYRAHAERLEVVLSKEAQWASRKPWDIVLRDIHLEGRFDEALAKLVEVVSTRDLSTFGPLVQPSTAFVGVSLRAEELEKLLPGLYRQLKDRTLSAERVWEMLTVKSSTQCETSFSR